VTVKDLQSDERVAGAAGSRGGPSLASGATKCCTTGDVAGAAVAGDGSRNDGPTVGPLFLDDEGRGRGRL
jgi:hypothetical protein